MYVVCVRASPPHLTDAPLFAQVEAALRSCASVSNAVVLPAKAKGALELIAFVEPTDDGVKAAALEKAALDLATEKLPYYMVPSKTHAGTYAASKAPRPHRHPHFTPHSLTSAPCSLPQSRRCQ